MNAAEVRRQVRRDIDSIKKAESGVLPPTPYVVMEIIRRNKTMKPWSDMPTTEPMSRAFRTMVEEILTSGPLPPEPPEDLDLKCLQPIEVVQHVRVRKHRHVRELSSR